MTTIRFITDHIKRFLLFSVCASAISGVVPATAQTINFDTLSAEPGISGIADFSTANGGAVISGITFAGGFQVAGNQYLGSAATAPDYFAASHSGGYALTGNAYAGTDIFGDVFNGLTITTNKRLVSLYVSCDDNGGGSNDAATVTVTAFGLGGDLAHVTVGLTYTPTLLNTSGISNIGGITGYRITTTASNDLYTAHGQAYIVADDLVFTTAPTIPVIDFNGDGKPDLVLENSTSRQVALWYLNGAALFGGAYVSSIPAAGWKVVGAADFNGDGKPDLVLQNTATTQIAVWYLNGATLSGGGYVSSIPGAGWRVAGVADFNGDGKPDLVLQNSSTNKAAIWYLNGLTLTSGAYVSSTLPAGWNAVGVADYNGDGKPDLVLQNASTNQIALWYLNGATLSGGGYVSSIPPAGWKVVGVGDYNHDGKQDIVLQNATSNQIALWYLNGTALLSGDHVSSTPAAGWVAVAPH